MLQLNHEQDSVYVINRSEYHVICQSDSDPRGLYVVCLLRSLDDWATFEVSCQCADWVFRRHDCKHIQRALGLMRRRKSDAVAHARKIAAIAKGAGWSRRLFMHRLQGHVSLQGDLWSGVRSVELELFEKGVIQDVL